MPWGLLLREGISCGLVLSVVLGAMIPVILMINPEIMLNDYPPDIRAKHGPISAKARQQRTIAGVIVIAAFVAILFVALSRLRSQIGAPLDYSTVLMYLLVAFTVFNVFDLIVLDWLMCIVIQPRFLFLPGTEGMKGYDDFGFHFRGFFIGMGLIAIVAPVMAGLVLFIQWILA